jgi:lysophospholipase L1-like esterase
VVFGTTNYLAHAIGFLNGKFCMGGIAATPGHNTAQIIADHLPQALASNWDYCLVGEPTNDLGDGLAVTETEDNIGFILDSLIAAGIVPIMTTAPPTDASATTPADYTWITKYNAWVKAEANRRGLAYVDYHTALVNPANGAAVAGYLTDGLHPSSTGARAMADELARVLNSIPLSAKNPLAGSYNVNLMVPDVVITSAGGDKAAGSGNTTGGWTARLATHAKYWKGNQYIMKRGTAGDFSLRFPIDAGKWVAGHRVRVAFAYDASEVPAGGGFHAYLYNLTQLQPICGLQAVPIAQTNNSLTVADAVVTSGSNQVTSALKKFRPEHVGHAASASVGVVSSIPAGTTVVGVSADGGTIYLSANATASQAVAELTLSGKPLIAVFEFDVQADMVGDDIRFYATASTIAGTTIGIAQVTVTDLTALGAV